MAEMKPRGEKITKAIEAIDEARKNKDLVKPGEKAESEAQKKALEAMKGARKDLMTAVFDRDGSGQVSKEEIKETMAEIRKATRADTNKDGRLSPEESKGLDVKTIPRGLMAASNILSRDGGDVAKDGVKEISATLKKMGVDVEAIEGPASGGAPRGKGAPKRGGGGRGE